MPFGSLKTRVSVSISRLIGDMKATRGRTKQNDGNYVYISLVLGSFTANKMIKLTMMPKTMVKAKGYAGSRL
jgi:hypothetical protein